LTLIWEGQNNITMKNMENKLCTKCSIEKPLSEYHNSNKTKDGKSNWCGQCNRERSKEYHHKNKEKISIKSKIYRKNNRNYFNQKNKEWNKKTKYSSIYQKQRLKNDYFFKFKHSVRTLLRISITKQGFTKKSKTYNILGCTHSEFIIYIENKFTKNMSWNNYGKWHLDHIKPISLAKDESEVISLNHYTNFQPMWAKDNLKKYNKFNETYGGNK